jgi:hypothetical protein
MWAETWPSVSVRHVYESRSQWPRDLRHELSSWVRITLEA